MRTALNKVELDTLQVLSNPERTECPSRGILEKLSRLDLIEPCPEGVCMTTKGREILVKRK